MWSGANVRRKNSTAVHHYITSHFSRKLDNSTSHANIYHEWQHFCLVIYNVQQDELPNANPARGRQTAVWILSSCRKNKWRNLNFHLGLNLFTLPAAWCPTSGEPRHSPVSLWRPAERNVQQNGNLNTLSPPRLLLKAFTVHWVRHATKHW